LWRRLAATHRDGAHVDKPRKHVMPNQTVTLEKQFSDEQLTRVLQQAAIYMCACPAQVCKAINQQRQLFAYQADCINGTDTDYVVHRRIAETVRKTHAELEICLRDVLQLEGWDMVTLEMPLALQKRMLDSIEDDQDG
jgi:leucyl aminopeptidase (aminopeptidase T)